MQLPQITDDLLSHGKVEYQFDFKTIKQFVSDKIRVFERRHNAIVLSAVEKSSHVWGTAHATSDNDVHCLFFYPPRAYYSVNNFCAEMARTNQNKKRNRNNYKKQRDLEEFKNNMFVREVKIQYGHRFKEDSLIGEENSDCDEINECDRSLDVEISFHEISNFTKLAMESNQNLFEIVSSPIIYYMVEDSLWKKYRNLIWNFYDHNQLSHSYMRLAVHNYRSWTVSSKNRTNRDDKKRVKTLFVIWRAILMTEWLQRNETLRNAPMFIPYLVTQTCLLDDGEKEKFLQKLKFGINQGIYEIDDVFEALKEAAGKALECLQSKNIKIESNHSEKRNVVGKELEELIGDMIEFYGSKDIR